MSVTRPGKFNFKKTTWFGIIFSWYPNAGSSQAIHSFHIPTNWLLNNLFSEFCLASLSSCQVCSYSGLLSTTFCTQEQQLPFSSPLELCLISVLSQISEQEYLKWYLQVLGDLKLVIIAKVSLTTFLFPWGCQSLFLQLFCLGPLEDSFLFREDESKLWNTESFVTLI